MSIKRLILTLISLCNKSTWLGLEKQHHGLAQQSHRKWTAGSWVNVQGLFDPSTSPPVHPVQLLILRIYDFRMKRSCWSAQMKTYIWSLELCDECRHDILEDLLNCCIIFVRGFSHAEGVTAVSGASSLMKETCSVWGKKPIIMRQFVFMTNKHRFNSAVSHSPCVDLSSVCMCSGQRQSDLEKESKITDC